MECEEDERAIHGGCPIGDGTLRGSQGYECYESGYPHVLCLAFEADDEDAGDVFWLVGGNHLNTDCEAAGGIVQEDDGDHFCRFMYGDMNDCEAAGGSWEETNLGSSYCSFGARTPHRDIDALCPSGWSQYRDWSSTFSTRCEGSSGWVTCTSPNPCETGRHSFADIEPETCTFESNVSGPSGCRDRTCYSAITGVGCN